MKRKRQSDLSLFRLFHSQSENTGKQPKRSPRNNQQEPSLPLRFRKTKRTLLRRVRPYSFNIESHPQYGCPSRRRRLHPRAF